MKEMKDDVMLVLDCSLRLTGAAVVRRGEVLSRESADLGRRQAAELPLMAERVLTAADMAFTDVGLTAVTSGPGYFTGIRVGVAYAAALAYGLGVRIVPVSSLEMLASSHPAFSAGTFSEGNFSGEVLAVVYAGRGFVYAASFGPGANALPVGEYGGEPLEAWMKGHSGAAAVSDDPGRAAEAAGLTFPIVPIRPDVARAAELAWARQACAVSPLEFRAVYCRAPCQGSAPSSPSL